MDELEGHAVRECALAGGEGILFRELMEEVGKRCGSAISVPLQTLLWRRLRLLTCLDFSRDALDREQQLQAQPRAEPGVKGQPLKPIPLGETLAQGTLPERLEHVQDLHRLRLTASAHTRIKELGWSATDSVQSVRVLEVISRSREKGILQTKIATATGLDAKSVFYYMKPLKTRDLIVHTSVCLDNAEHAGNGPKHIKTNIVYLKCFAPAAGDEAAAHEGVNTFEDMAPIVARALQFLQDSPGGITGETRCKKYALLLWQAKLDISDKIAAKSKCNHMWERVRRSLESRRLIQRVVLRADDCGVKREHNDDNPGDDAVQTQHHQQEIICLKLLDDAAAAAAQQSSTGGQKMVAQVSMLEQMMRVIQRAGPEGVLQSDLQKMLGMDQRVAYDLAMQLVQFFGVQPSPEMVGRQTCYRLTSVSAGGHEGAARSDSRKDAASCEQPSAGSGEAVGEGAAGGEERSGGRRGLTREWVMRHEGWEKGAPCTEQWLQRSNALLERLAQQLAMMMTEVNLFLNGLAKPKRAGKMDRNTSVRLVAQLESLGLLKRGTYKVAGGGYSRLSTASDLQLFEETRDVEVIHLPEVKPDGPEVAAALKGKGKNGLTDSLEVVEVAQEVATQILLANRDDEKRDLEWLAWQTGAFLNGYVSCKVKRWSCFHKFIVKHFLGYSAQPQEAAGYGRQGEDPGEIVPPPPPDPPSSSTVLFAPKDQGIKKSVVAGGGEEKTSRGLSMQEIVDAMPVVLFLHVVGCGEYVPGLDNLIARNVLMGDCPQDVRRLLFRQDKSTYIKMVRHRIMETLDALETIGLTRTVFEHESLGGASAAAKSGIAGAPEPEVGGEVAKKDLPRETGMGKEKDGTVHAANAIVVQREVHVVFDADGQRMSEKFTFSCEEDVDCFWRTLAVRSRNHMQATFLKSEPGDDYESDEAYELHAQASKKSDDVPLFERFPMLGKRKTWSNLAFGDCTATQRESVTALLKKEHFSAADQGCDKVMLRSLVCSADAIAIALRVSRECQLSREVVAKLLSRLDSKVMAPFSEPLLPSVGSRLNQLSVRKRMSRLGQESAVDGDGERGASGVDFTDPWPNRKGYKGPANSLKRQRRRRTAAEDASENGDDTAGESTKRARKRGTNSARQRRGGKGDGLERSGAEGSAHNKADADWEESDGEGIREEEGITGKFPKSRSQRKMWQIEDDVHLLIVYAQAVEMSFAEERREDAEVGSVKMETEGGAGAFKGRVEWRVVAGAVGLTCQQCQRRIKNLSSDLPRLRMLYRMTSRAAVETMMTGRPALRLAASAMDAEAICKSMQHILNNLHLSVSTAPIDNLDKNSLPPNLPPKAEDIRAQFQVEAMFPTRLQRHAWPGASPAQACILDLLFLVLSEQQEHYNSELALRLLGRFPEADVERALTVLREKGMIVKRRGGDRSCGLSRALEDLMSPSRAYTLLQSELGAVSRKRKWSLDERVSGGLVARTAMVLLDKRLKVDTLVPDSLGLVAAPGGDKKFSGAGGGGVGAHILSAMLSEDESDVGGRLLDQRVSLPQCQVVIHCWDEEDSLGVSGPGRNLGEGETDAVAVNAVHGMGDVDMQEISSQTRSQKDGSRACINMKFVMLLPLWDENEEEGIRVRGPEWCRERLASLLEAISTGREEGLSLGDFDLKSLGFVGKGGGDNINAGERGLGWHVKRESGALSSMELLEKALITLQNQGKILRVRALDHHRYVAARWSHMWSLNRESTRTRPQIQVMAAGAGAEASGSKIKGKGKTTEGAARKGGEKAAEKDGGDETPHAVTEREGEQTKEGDTDAQRAMEETIKRTREALADAQVSGPWLSMSSATSSAAKASDAPLQSSFESGPDPLENLRTAICETVYKHPGMPESALEQRFHMLNPRTLGDVVAGLEMEGAISSRALVVPECSVFSAEIPTYIPRASSVFPSTRRGGGASESHGGCRGGAGMVKRFLFPRQPVLAL